MARRRIRFARASAPSIVRVASARAPAPIVIRTGGGGMARRARAGLSRAYSRGAQLAKEESHTITAVAAGAALGFVEARGIELPKVEAIGLAGTYGLVALLIGRQTGSRIMRHVATGLLTCAARDTVRGWAT